MANTYFDFVGRIYHPTYRPVDDFGNCVTISPSLHTIMYNYEYGMYNGLDYYGNELDFGY